MDERIKNLIMEVGQGNPGALTVISELMWYTRWHQMLEMLLDKGIVGGKLWELYKDEYKKSTHDLGNYLEDELQKFNAKRYAGRPDYFDSAGHAPDFY